MAEKAILFDSTKCMACRACQVACKQWNELPGQTTKNIGSYENPPGLSPNTRIRLRFAEVSLKNGSVDWLFTRQSCMHCTDATCATVCPTGAMFRHEMGFVAVDKTACSGCGYCAEFCPFGVPKMTGNKVTGMAMSDKCVMCQDRVTSGLEPACVKTCPPNALTFGGRDEIVASGNQRVQQLQSAGYTDASLYGEKELGGLHVMYVLTNSAESYGLPVKPEVPSTATAWQNVIQPVGSAVLGLTVAGLILNFLVARSTVKAESGKPEQSVARSSGSSTKESRQ